MSSSSSSSSRYFPPIRPPFIHYNSLHAPPPPFPVAPDNIQPYHNPQLGRYPPLYVRSTDPAYPDHRQYIQIKRVGKQNFEQVKNIIKEIVETTEYNFVTIDTEYPGTIRPTNEFIDRHPKAQYSLMKDNVDVMSLIQVGLTLSDAAGNLVTWGPRKHAIVWEFIISDFDMLRQPYNQESIRMLYFRGMDFKFHREEGITSLEFVKMLRETGLVWDRQEGTSDQGLVQDEPKGDKNIGWITFQGAYDFGYLIKALTNSKLPNTLEEFMKLVQRYFGEQMYDVKCMLKLCCDKSDMELKKKLMGGLEVVAAKTGAWRVMGMGNQSGSDSLLILMVFKQVKKLYDEDGRVERACAGHLHPLAPSSLALLEAE